MLLQQTNRLFPSAFPTTPSYPFAPANNENIDIHYPDWPVPLTHQYSLGFQRSLGRDTAIEMRYVGNTNVGGWETWNMNAHQQWSILENGYFDEFQQAQDNLRANIVAGRGQHVRVHRCSRDGAAADLHGVLQGHSAQRSAE